MENARVENEVMLLRKRIAQSLNRSNSFPNLVRCQGPSTESEVLLRVRTVATTWRRVKVR